jgi:hypothetical protein
LFIIWFVNVAVCEAEIFESVILLKDQITCMSRSDDPYVPELTLQSDDSNGSWCIIGRKRPVKHVRASRVLDEAVGLQ